MGVPDPLYARPLQNKRSSGRSQRMARLDHVHSAVGIQQVLFRLVAANMNVTTDQILSKVWDFDEYIIDTIRVRDADGTLSTAAGGIYLAAGKSGAIVGSGQAYSGITAAGQGLNLTLQPAGMAKLTATPILSLTTAQGAARVATLEIIGIPLTEL